MNHFKLKSTPLALLIFTFITNLSAPCNAEMLAWRSTEGELNVIEVVPTESFSDVITKVQEKAVKGNLDEQSTLTKPEFILDFMVASHESTAKTLKSIQRNYENSPTEDEVSDISYILTTLGNGTIARIARARNTLKKAGSRIEHLHPFHFIEQLFSTEKHKAALNNLRGRTFWIWSDFFSGIKRSLDEEADKDNLERYIDDFSQTLGVNSGLITPMIQKRQWKELVDTLLKELPRSGNPERYDQ